MENIEQLVDPLHLEDLRNEAHPSLFDDNEGYDMLIVRLPIVGKTLDVLSTGFVFTSDNSYLYNKAEQAFEAFNNRFEGPHHYIDKVLNQLMKSFSKYQDTVADMSELLYAKQHTSDFMDSWFKLKHDILRIEHVLLRTSLTMNEFVKHYRHEEEFPMNHYVDLHEHIERTMRSASLQLSKLDDLYSFYTAHTNEKMNRMIYILTIISAIFLPLNLIVGFFGMNTSGLPFSAGTFGTLNATLLMGTLLVITSGVILLWRKKTNKA